MWGMWGGVMYFGSGLSMVHVIGHAQVHSWELQAGLGEGHVRTWGLGWHKGRWSRLDL